jgi:hypothetical protein
MVARDRAAGLEALDQGLRLGTDASGGVTMSGVLNRVLAGNYIQRAVLWGDDAATLVRGLVDSSDARVDASLREEARRMLADREKRSRPSR